jgi:DNA-binding MarR family transcriptional regulator
MAQTVTELEDAGLLARRQDPTDGRRMLIELTDDGRVALTADRREREGWLAQVIADRLTPKEQRMLHEAVRLLDRLADD